MNITEKQKKELFDLAKGIRIRRDTALNLCDQATTKQQKEHFLRLSIVQAAKEYKLDKIAIAGGVASNSGLREAMKQICQQEGIAFYYPSPIYCTDNAAMIGVAAYYEYLAGTRHGWDLNAVPNLKLGERYE